jgi:hypothetical protein
MIRRKRVGTTYTKAPVDKTKMWFVANLNKVVFSIIISILYLGLLYLGIKIVLFLAVNVAEMWEDLDAYEIYTGPYGILLKILGISAIMYYVFHDKLQRRK